MERFNLILDKVVVASVHRGEKTNNNNKIDQVARAPIHTHSNFCSRRAGVCQWNLD